jgi:outer membrane lipoprotein carrier protein
VKRLTIFITAIFFISFFSCAHANPASDTLTQLLNNTRTMQADFTEVVKDTKGKTLNRSQGKMSLERPGKFRWDVIKPNPQLIVTNGKKIWIYDADLEQVTIRYLSKEPGEAPALLLSNANETLTKDFSVDTSNQTNTQWFSLRPKDKNSMFEFIKLGFQNQQITEMQLKDHLGHVTLIQFNRVVINNNLSPALFNFKVPAKVDVIDETHR